MNVKRQTEITPEMTVLDIVCKYRETEQVFKRYDMIAGECICCNALFDKLKDVTEKYKLDLQEILHALNCAE